MSIRQLASSNLSLLSFEGLECVDVASLFGKGVFGYALSSSYPKYIRC